MKRPDSGNVDHFGDGPGVSPDPNSVFRDQVSRTVRHGPNTGPHLGALVTLIRESGITLPHTLVHSRPSPTDEIQDLVLTRDTPRTPICRTGRTVLTWDTT